MRPISRALSLCLTVSAMLGSAVPFAASAQEISDTNATGRDLGAAAPASEQSGVDEIVVTATRRSESLQKVPIAITVLDGAALRAANLNTLKDIAAQVPTLNFRTAASNKDQALFLRGIGTVSTSPGVEPSVSTVLDGVVLARQGQATLDLLDIEQLEVIRGPQGTLFGKNASAGVLNIASKLPSAAFGGVAEIGYYGGGDEYRGRVRITGPLIEEKVAASLVASASRYGGNVTNQFNGATVNGYERVGARARFLVDPTDTIRVVLTADYAYSRDTTPQGVVTRTFLTAYPTNAVTNYPAFAAALLPVVASQYNDRINSNYDTYLHDDNYGLSAQADIKLDEFALTSITAWRGWRNTQFQDQDRLPRVVIGFPQQHDVGKLAFEQVSQEVRLASPTGEIVDYVAGLFYFRGMDDEVYRRDSTTVTATTAKLDTGIARYGVTNDSIAGFAEGHVNVTDQLRIILGGRVTRDELSYDFVRTSTSPVAVTGIQTAFTASGSTENTGFSGRFGLQLDLDPDAMIYATYARGYKGPAYNPAFSMLPQDTLALKPETSNAYEVGLKSKLLEGRLTLDVALFLDKLQNYQVPFFDTFNGSAITRLINAGKVSTQGVEVDTAVTPLPDLTLSGSLAYTDAHIDSFACPAGTTASCQVNGGRLTFAPRWKANGRVDYSLPLTDTLELVFASDISWQTRVQYSINETPDTIEGPHAIWNARVGLATADGWKLNVLVNNIADRRYSPYLTRFGSGVVRFVPRDDRRYAGFNVAKAF